MAPTSKRNPFALASVGIDIGKEVFHLVGFDLDGKIVLRRKIRRLALVSELEKLPPCIIGMEACLSAHFVSRTVRKLGHEPRIIPAFYVKPFVKGQKNDYNDAEAIAEAAVRPNLKIVREKTQDQLDLQALHRVRSRMVSRRTATINQIRAFLIEQGRARLAELALCDPAEPQRRDIAAHEKSDCRPPRRLAASRRAHRDHHRRDRDDQQG
jgi:transposase